MALVTITKDPVDPHKSTRCINLDRKISIRDCANEMLGNWESEPWFCVIVRDGEIYYPLRKEWDEEIKSEDKVYFLPYVGDPVSIILAIIVIVLVVAVLFLTMQNQPDPPETGDPVFSIDGKSNKARLGQPIEDSYGRNKIWASYCGAPYTEYYDFNSQRLFQWLNLGHGQFHIIDYLIADTSVTKAPKYDPLLPFIGNVTQPLNLNNISVNAGVLGFSNQNNVVTCPQVQNIDLLGTNQEGGGEWIGPFAVNPPDTTVQLIAIDFAHPSGCYTVDKKKGRVQGNGANIAFQLREINNGGAALASFAGFVPNIEAQIQVGNGSLSSNDYNDGWHNHRSIDTYFSTTQAVRKTYFSNAPLASRWEIRARRTDSGYTEANGTNASLWVAVKGYRGNITPPNWVKGGKEGIYDFHVRTIATQNNAKNRFTVLAERKLDQWTYENTAQGSWTNGVTRNPIWAMVEILRRPWGANLRDDQIDLAAMKIAADQADEAGETFDWTFNQSMTVWEAIKVCASVCRCVPLMNGGLVSVVRDVPQYIPVALFNSENIHQNSFKIQRRLYNNEAHDGLKATYLDHETWRNETVLATLNTQQGYNPKTTNLRGVTNRTQALKLANYLWASEHYNRQIIKFKTSYSAISISYGDIIKVSTDIADWGQSGQIEEIELGRIFTTSEPLVFNGSQNHNITFRDKLGGVYGPFLVIPVISNPPEELDKYKCQLSDVGVVDETRIPVSDDVLKPQYIFGEVNKEGVLCKVNKVSNQGIDDIEIEAVVENYGRFQFDDDVAPEITYPVLLPIPVPANVVGLRQTLWTPASRTVKVEWLASTNPTADSYFVEYGIDGVGWNSAGSTSSLFRNFILPASIDVLEQQLFISVRALNSEGYGERSVIAPRADTPDFLVDDDTPDYNQLEVENLGGEPIKIKS